MSDPLGKATHSNMASGMVAKQQELLDNPYALASQALSAGRQPRPIDPKPECLSDRCVPVPTADAAQTDAITEEYNGNRPKTEVGPVRERASREPAFSELPSSCRLMTVCQVAALLNVSVSTVWRLLKKDARFPRPIKIGGSTRWDRADIDRYLDSLSSAAHAAR